MTNPTFLRSRMLYQHIKKVTLIVLKTIGQLHRAGHSQSSGNHYQRNWCRTSCAYPSYQTDNIDSIRPIYIESCCKFDWRGGRVLDEGFSSTAVLCDMTKAIDCVTTDILLFKLGFYGVRNTQLKLLASYLTNRTQYASYGDEWSAIVRNSCGIPQGSVSGPILFLIYISATSRRQQITWLSKSAVNFVIRSVR